MQGDWYLLDSNACPPKLYNYIEFYGSLYILISLLRADDIFRQHFDQMLSFGFLMRTVKVYPLVGYRATFWGQTPKSDQFSAGKLGFQKRVSPFGFDKIHRPCQMPQEDMHIAMCDVSATARCAYMRTSYMYIAGSLVPRLFPTNTVT